MATDEQVMAAAVRLIGGAEAAAALAAHARVRQEGLEIDPDIAERLATVAEHVIGSDTDVSERASAQVVGMARALLREALSLVEQPGRSGDWATVDPMVLQGLGRLSMSIADVFAVASQGLEGLGEALQRDDARILDVGTGTGWLAIALARRFPSTQVTGIDVFEPALELARKNVAEASLGDRVCVRELNVLDLPPSSDQAVVWLPLPFLPRAIVPAAIARVTSALAPGGWVLAGTFAGADDDLSRALNELRILRSGGFPWSGDSIVAMLSETGLTAVTEVPRTWAAPVRLWAGRRPVD